MATIQNRSFNRDYSGLKNQLQLGGAIVVICLTGYELMRKKRRGRGLRASEKAQDIGSVETWEFGYLYQGRCWAKKPSPALPRWPLAWVKQAIVIPERILPDLIGIDATLYIRFLRGCLWFTFLQTFTTFPIVLAIHTIFSPSNIPKKSMDKASISSLVQSNSGLHMLYVHVILAYYVSITWIITLLWIARGIFWYRALAIQSTAEKLVCRTAREGDTERFADEGRDLELRTIMVTNLPVQLRSEKELKEYFEYYMSRPIRRVSSSHGSIPKMMHFFFNRIAESLPVQELGKPADNVITIEPDAEQLPPIVERVERVIVARKMTELASLIERREDILRRLEYAHIQLARKALQTARGQLSNPAASIGPNGFLDRIILHKLRAKGSIHTRQLDEEASVDGAVDHIARLNLVTNTLAPHVYDFHPPSSTPIWCYRIWHRYSNGDASSLTNLCTTAPPTKCEAPPDTVWDALHSLPRSQIDAYQPLINLSALGRSKMVPAIDYYAAKLGLLTALISENRARVLDAYTPSSTAFVTFEKIGDARRAAKYMQAHPRNPMACLAVPAPHVADLDWTRLMTSTFTGEFIKDWVVNLGVWAFTCSWIFPISLLVGLVTVQNISTLVPGLQNYLNDHPQNQEVISNLLPSTLVSILTVCVPTILLLIAKKANTIMTVSELNDTLMIRYWKFVICNLLVFFCVGVAALESIFQSLKHSVNPLPLLASSFPTASPFYVGWRERIADCSWYTTLISTVLVILQTAVHAFLELGLVGPPLIAYLSTRRANTLRQRAAGLTPRPSNLHRWLPNHVLITTITVCFALLNPLVIPFAFIYFSVVSVIIKHQLVHVYAKMHGDNGKLILIRIVRYSLDGLILAHAVFLIFLVFLKQKVHAGMIAVLLALTAIGKISITRLCREKFTEADRAEDAVYSGGGHDLVPPQPGNHEIGGGTIYPGSPLARVGGLFPNRFWASKLVDRVYFPSFMRRLQCPKGTGVNPIDPRASFTTNEMPEKSLPLPETRNDRNVHAEHPDTPAAMQVDPKQPPITDRKSHVPLSRRNTEGSRRSIPQLLVTPHAKHQNWDDFPQLSCRYENPYYVQPVDNFLWLPRNPFGILDLDDSVDLHRALTTEPGAGQIGQWMNENIDVEIGSLVEAPAPTHPAGPVRSESTEENLASPLEHQSGHAEKVPISSPPSANADGIDRDGVEHANLPQPPLTANMQSITSYPSAAQVSQHVEETASPADAGSIHSISGLPLSNHSQSGLGHRDEIPEGLPGPTSEALVREVISEERAEAADRIRQEEEEKRRKESKKSSWWNAWMWDRTP